MAKKKKQTAIPSSRIVKMRRENRITFCVNEKEAKVLEQFYEKYKINNRSRFLRETIMAAILKRFDEDYPTLFNEKEMR
jgi:nickel-dependent lactate racemase